MKCAFPELIIQSLIFLCLLHVSNPRTDLQEDSCIHSYGMVQFTLFWLFTSLSSLQKPDCKDCFLLDNMSVYCRVNLLALVHHNVSEIHANTLHASHSATLAGHFLYFHWRAAVSLLSVINKTHTFANMNSTSVKKIKPQNLTFIRMEHMSGVPAHTIKCETYPSFLQVDKWYLTVTNMRTQRLTIVYSIIRVFLIHVTCY